jgi:hypothetical protein
VYGNQKSVIITVIFGLTWAGAVGFGVSALVNYETAPGPVGTVSATLPKESLIKLAVDRPTLVMLAHPSCPCTRASVGELAKLMAHVKGKVRAYVLFYAPAGSGAEWQDTDLRRSAAQIPGVIALSDIDGAEARRLGAETSGHTFLFGPDGRLLFNGGITASRGHSGDNAGESALASLIDNGTSSRTNTLVFGCALRDRKGGKACLK